MFGSPQIQIPQWLKKMLMTQPDIIKKKGVGEENASYMKLWQWTKQNKWSSGKDANCENWKIEIAYIICQRHIQNHIKNLRWSFAKIVNPKKLSTIFAKHSILDILKVSEWISGCWNIFYLILIFQFKTTHLDRCKIRWPHTKIFPPCQSYDYQVLSVK